MLEYYAAIEVTKVGTLPKDMVSVEIPSSTYAKFTHQGEAKNIDKTVNYIYSSWLIQSGKRHTYSADLEIYGADYDPGSNGKIHYAIPIE